ncbi:hypothetical protein ACFWHR_08360 [Leucobacter sp. NPDC058333]|uniref:hypothetical protein n=1 Tax=Leucobacter sp. NPDC058333 TaxID=3346450 RepID=UPI003653D2CD
MDLKFSFGGASPDHHHGDDGGAPSGIPLPFTTVSSGALGSTSTVLDASVRREGDLLVGEVVTGDGVTYARAEVALRSDAAGAALPDTAALAKAARSALSRAVATLEGPLAESISAVVFALGDASRTTAEALGVAVTDAPVVGDALQRRIGVAAHTPVRIGA